MPVILFVCSFVLGTIVCLCVCLSLSQQYHNIPNSNHSKFSNGFKWVWYPLGQNATTSMVGLKNGHIRKNLIQNGDLQRSRWKCRRRRRRMSVISKYRSPWCIVHSTPYMLKLTTFRHSVCCWCSFFFFFFLRSPAISLGFTTFGWDFCVCDRFFNPTIKVVTFRLRGWCVLGVFFVAGIHPSRTWTSGSFESVRWNACMHRLDLGLYSHPKEFWGEWSLNPC